MKFIQIPAIEDFSEHLQYVSSSSLHKERMEAMEALRKQVNEAIALHEKHQDIDKALAQALSSRIETEDIRAKAREYAKWKRAEGDKKYDEAITAGAKHLADIDARINLLKEQKTKLDSRESKLDAQAVALENKAQEVQKREADANKKAADALILKAQYEDRYNRIMMAARD